jgi:hypothetical protein
MDLKKGVGWSMRVQNGFKWLRKIPEFSGKTEMNDWIPRKSNNFLSS